MLLPPEAGLTDVSLVGVDGLTALLLLVVLCLGVAILVMRKKLDC